MALTGIWAGGPRPGDPRNPSHRSDAAGASRSRGSEPRTNASGAPYGPAQAATPTTWHGLDGGVRRHPATQHRTLQLLEVRLCRAGAAVQLTQLHNNSF